MFSSLGLFKHIECPKRDDCDLHACIFSHVKPSRVDSVVEEYDPFNTGYILSPPAKRQKIYDEATTVEIKPLLTPSTAKPATQEQQRPSATTELKAQSKAPKANPSKLNSVTPAKKSTPQTSKPDTATRPISPPPVKPKSPATEKPEPKKEPLLPRNVPSLPVTFQKRQSILQLFHRAIQSKDRMSAGGDPKWKALLLSEQELIKYALDREEEAARKFEGNVYQSHLGTQMVQIKKMTAKDWRDFVDQIIRGQVEKPGEPKQAIPPRPKTGLPSIEEEILILRAIRTSIAGLEDYGYVTSPPTAEEITSARAGVEASAGFEQCDRCLTRFRVYPGRDEGGKLTSGGTCQYHWAKPYKPPAQRTDQMTGSGRASHPCCGQLPGSPGCTEGETHVFIVKDAKRLASIWQFEATSTNANAVKTPVSFDCEMGYTTLGMEVIRVTAVSWPEGRDLLDVLVRPLGEILDLNTRFSGVSQRQFADASVYGEEREKDDTSEDKELEEQLRKVKSPAAARQLLFDLIGPETPLIGHAIDNDLNTLRIIHPLVVDTVLLYPHPRGLPIKYGLKVLARQYLDRSIQSSGAAGHDSKEDALATGDLVTLKVAEKWRQMKAAGWTFEAGKLVAPASQIARAAL